MDEEKKCAVCNKETMLALVGVGIGLLFVVIGLDTLRRMRISAAEVETEDISSD